MLNQQPIHRICVIMLGLMGDVLMRTAFTRELRRQFPDADICAVVDPIGRELLAHNPDINRTIVMYRKRDRWLRYLSSKIRMHTWLPIQRFDLLIDLYAGESSRRLMRLSAAKFQLGFDRQGALWCNSSVNQVAQYQVVPSTNPHHLNHALFQLLGRIDHYSLPPTTRPVFVPDTSQSAKIDSLMSTLSDKNVYLLSLGSGGLEKILDLDKQFALIQRIHQTDGIIPMIVCNPSQEHLQRELIDRFLQPNHIPYLELPLLGLNEIALLMTHSRWVMLPDTGLYHLAVALAIPIFCIFTHTNPELVRPDGGKYVLCFKPTSHIGQAGLPLGTKEIDQELLWENYRQLKQML